MGAAEKEDRFFLRFDFTVDILDSPSLIASPTESPIEEAILNGDLLLSCIHTLHNLFDLKEGTQIELT